MSKISSYKKLYYVGFAFLLIIVSLLVYSLAYISKQYNWIHKDSSDKFSDTTLNQPDTIYQEKIIETLRVDTFKIYIPVKPKVEKKDTTTNPSLSVSGQSQN
jgi:hypothetical protein